jgi:hypothetical protein
VNVRVPSIAICSVAMLFSHQITIADEACPRTIGADKVFAEPWPQGATWFGTEALAVMLPKDGVWPTTAPGRLIAVKLIWYTAGFKPGMERHFVGQIERLDKGPNDAVMSRPTHAGGESLGAWTIMVGLNFPSAGCWRIAGEYLGQKLAFVVETVDYSNYL